MVEVVEVVAGGAGCVVVMDVVGAGGWELATEDSETGQ